ncbi:MAG: hypothetical protein HZC48_09445 [Nitrospirae bacterium]|nr:hypothetical protein [Nitrospirota bacterium]
MTKISLDSIIKAVEQECGDKPEISRKAAIYISHRYSGRTLREIGERFGVGESAVARSSGRFESELKGSRMLKKRIENVHKVLALSKV